MPSLTVSGMSCEHCRSAVQKAASSIPGVAEATVDLNSGTLTWKESAPVDVAALKSAITKIGFEVKD